MVIKVKSPFQSDIERKGNLGANTKFLGSQNLHDPRELFCINLAQINLFCRSNYILSLTEAVQSCKMIVHTRA